jgi:hypothetical protein
MNNTSTLTQITAGLYENVCRINSDPKNKGNI